MPSVGKSLLWWMMAGVLWATGCAGVGSAVSDAGDVSGWGVPLAAPEPPEGVAAPIYLMLVGEIAGQRGQFDVALDHYLKLMRLVPDVRVAERATQIALYVKDTDKALEAASLWSGLDSKSLAAHRLTAVLEIKAGHMDKASDELGKLIALKDPELENTLIELVKWLDAEMPKEQSLAIMQQLAESHPKVPELHFAYALLASNKEALMTARVEVEKAISLRPKWGRAQMLQAQLLMQSGDTKAARVALEKALKSDPGNARVGLLYAQFLAKAGEYKSAERELKRILEKDGGNHDARFTLASVWLEMGEYERARAEFQLLTGDPRWQAQSDFSIGLIDARLGKTENALRQFDRVGPGPLEFDARFNGISALIGLGRYDEARDRLAKSRKAYPNEKVRLYLIEAEMLVKSKDVATAYGVLDEALKDEPRQTDLLYSRALMAEQLGHLDVMEADLRAVLSKKPDDPAALNALGFSLAEHRLDRLDEAEGYIKQAMEKRLGDPAILDSYGWVLYRKGQRDQALVYLRKAYKLFADPEIAAHLGEVLWETGQKAEARRVWAEGQKKNPDQEDMKGVREKYPEGFGRTGK
jgi:tetratricopeptide (TPR) repeat protein